MNKLANTIEDHFLLKKDYKCFSRGFMFWKTRKREIVIPRQIYCYFRFNELADRSKSTTYERNINEQIGLEVGLNQATARHSIKTIKDLLSVDKNLSKDIEILEKKIEIATMCSNIEVSEQEIQNAIVNGLCQLIKKKNHENTKK